MLHFSCNLGKFSGSLQSRTPPPPSAGTLEQHSNGPWRADLAAHPPACVGGGGAQIGLVLLGRRDLHQRSFSTLKLSLSLCSLLSSSLSLSLPLFSGEREVINGDLKSLDGFSGQREEGAGLQAGRHSPQPFICILRSVSRRGRTWRRIPGRCFTEAFLHLHTSALLQPADPPETSQIRNTPEQPLHRWLLRAPWPRANGCAARGDVWCPRGCPTSRRCRLLPLLSC